MPPPLPANLNQPQNVQQLSASGVQQSGPQASQFHQQHVSALAQHHHQNVGAGTSTGTLGVSGSGGIQQITASSSSIQSGSNIIGGINVLPPGVQQQHLNIAQKLHAQHIQQQQLQQQHQQQQHQQNINTASAAGLMMSSSGGIPSDTLLTTEINKFRSYVVMLADHTSKDDSKLKAAQELNESFEIILQAPDYPKFLDHCIKNFLKILSEGEPLFISEYNIQQMRKLLLEMIHRFPTNQDLKPHLPAILTTVLRLLNVENEENTLVCLRIIIELHKMFRPPYNTETQKFLQYVKSIYAELPNHLNRIFEPRSTLKVKDLSAINIEQQLKDTFTLTIIQSEMKSQDGTAICYNLIPKGTMSLKVLQELPIIVVLFFQIYKENVKQDIREYITLIMNTITLQPSLEQRKSPSFNKEVFVDFMGAQIKTLSFIAYIIRSHHEDVAAHSQQMVHGILGLLELCPQEVCHLRKELLIAIRHIVATDLKKKFVPHMERLFDENILLGNGWTVRDTLRPLAYSTLADLVHHVRQDLPLTDLARAVHLFGKIVHDPTLNTTIQTMSCKLLLNLVDCIKNQSKGEKNAVQCRELLMRMLEIFVLKFKTFAKLQLPILINKSKPLMQQNLQSQVSVNNMTAYQQQQTQQAQQQTEIKQEPGTNNVEIKQEPGQGTARLASTLTPSATGTGNVPPQTQQETQEKSKFGFPQQQMSYNVADYRNLVKTLVCGVKTITWGCSSININELPNGEQGKDTLVFIRLVKWAMKALDIYQVQLPNAAVMAQFQGRQMHNRIMSGPNQNVRTQEEKEVLEHFSGVFSLMSTSVFRDVFSTCISYMVERIHQNLALQTIANTFLANPPTSSVFATVLVEYLLERMHEMGSPIDRSNLYLRLFKVLFGSVTLFKENELMLKPHLHQIVNRSMELSTNAKEPYNYFLLLRALFRSIGGGSHDLLYEVFLPLLPNLLEGLNRLQSGLHKPHMKDLFVELCLTVPVRLSSLLPYLPMLMDPLVSALNGSHTLVSQGLRTLELCVDNLQPEFLYEHIQPVRADLMQALWRTLRNPDQVAHVAFRVLGKFGGGNRKMMIEPQRLEYNDRENPGPAIVVEFQDHERSIEFPVEKIIETAVNALKSSTTDSFYHKQCWEVIRCYLAASLNLTDRKHTMLGLFLYPSFVNDPIDQTTTNPPLYKCPDRVARKTHLTALTGMFVAAAIKELRQDVQPRMVSLVTHYTMVAIAQQAGPAPVKGKITPSTFLDPLVLIDALAVIMAHEEKELCKPGYLALGLILDTATNILGSKEKACQLPLMDYLKDRMCALCYERAWYSKLGGCIAIKFLFERMSTRWVYQHLYTFLKALIFVMMDLTGEVSNGALDMAKSNLRKMLTICIAPVDPKIVTAELLTAREKALYDVTSELLGLVTSPHTLVREQAMYCIRVLAGCCGTKGVDPQFSASILAPHIEVLTDIINSNVLELSKETNDKILTICIVQCDLNKSNNNTTSTANTNNLNSSSNINLNTDDIQTVRDKAFYDVTNELARLAASKDVKYIYKEHVVYCLRVLITCKTILNALNGGVTSTTSTITTTTTTQTIAVAQPQTPSSTLLSSDTTPASSASVTNNTIMPMVMQPHLDVLKHILTSDGFSTVAKVMVSHIDILKATIPNWSAGATKLIIERLLILLCTTMNEYKTIITQSSSPPITLNQQELNNIIQVRDKVIQDVTNELVRLIATLTTTHTSSSTTTIGVGSTTVGSTLSTAQQTSSTPAASQTSTNVNTHYLLIKEQAMYCLRVFAECNGFSGGDDGSIASIMSPHIEVLKDIVPPTKHQLILQPANAQIGLMDGNTFCMMLTPRLFTFDLKIPTHKSFFDELLLLLCKSHDALTKLQCYKNLSNLVLVRKAALRCISTYHRLTKEVSVKIFQVLYDALGWENNELQETAYECMHKFINGYQIDIDLVRQTMRTLLISLGDSRNLTLNFVKRLSYLTKLFPAIFNEKLCEQLLQHLKQFLDNLKDVKKLTKNGENEQKIAIIILIFHRITSASPKFISILCELVLETEKQLLVEASSAFREPLMKFLLKHPGETLELFLQDYRLKDQQWSRYLIFLIKHNDGKPFRDYLQNYCVPRLIQLILVLQNNTNQQLTLQDKYELRHQSIRIISLLIKYDSQWLSKQSQIIDALKQIWCDDAYQELHTKVDTVDITHWKQPKLIVKILLQYFQHDPQQIELLFELLRAFCHRFIPDFQFLRDFLETCVAQNYTIEWKRQAFFKFVEVFKNDQVSQVLKCHIVQLILIPCFSDSGTENMNALIAGSNAADSQQPNVVQQPNIVQQPNVGQQPNVVTFFIYNIIEKQSFNLEDCLRIALLQFSCLLVEQASPHIHDSSSNKQQGNKLRKLMTFAWPCLLVKNCVDATTRYHGHLLLAHIIEKFAIHKKIVLQVFHSLVKAHAQEARAVVKQALEILTPAMPFRMEDGNTMLIHWTKKIIVEEGHSVQQLYHILQLVVRHYKVYYPVRHHLIQYIVNSINRLGFSQTSTLEHKKLAVELAEVIVKWELQRLKDDEVDDSLQQDKKRIALTGTNQQPIPASTTSTTASNVLGNLGQPPQSTTPSPKIDADARKPIKSKDADAVINFLLRLACQVNESSNSAIPIQQAGGAGTPGEMLSKRCVTLLKTALKPELWPQKCDLKLDEWFNKVFLTVDGRDPNYANISTALELLNFLLSVMKHEQILNNFVHLQTGLSACLYTKETKIISLVHNLLSKLVSMFPVELSGANFGCQYEQLRVLYCNVGTMISDGLRNYEEDPKPVPSSLFGPLMILKACCTKNPACIDKIITAFMKVLQKMTKEHLSSTSSNDNSGPDKLASELLILSLDLVKTRVVVMSVEQRKTFIGTILVGLIEKTQDIKVMRAITRMLEEWIKCRNPITLQQAPSLREKSILLVKLMQYVEKRFPDDIELNTQFLELVNYVYSDEHLKTTELSMKLQPAFMSGLRCTVQPAIRAKFFQVLDASMRRRLIDRLLYIVCSQSWDAIGPHYWLKQCIELLLVTAVSSKPIQMAPNSCLLPSVEAVLRNTDSKVKDKVFEFIQKDPVICAQQQQGSSTTDTLGNGGTPQKSKPDRIQTIEQHVNQQADYLSKAREVETGQFLQAAAQLCHMDTQLAERVWLDMFPRLWSILYSNQHTMLIPEIISFVSSGTHVIQKDCHPSALTTFLEALAQCTPTIPIKPAAMKYLGKSHNLWHRMTLNLEQMAFDQNASTQVQKQKRDANMDCYDFETDQISPQAEIMDSLSDMYALLSEEDMWSGLWQRHAKFRETVIAISFEQHGFFEQAQGAYEVAMSRYKQDTNVSQKEVLLWEQRWIRCAKELNQWDLLLEYGVSKHERNSFLILESSWRVPNWTAMKEALAQVEYSCPKEMAWKVNLYRGFLGICNTEERHLQVVDRCVELASGLCMREWRRLPKIVSHAHLPLLQAAQQIMELQEAAAQIYQRLVQPSPGLREPYDDMKAIVKTWKNRLPAISDDLSHWSDIFTWRQHHYQFIAKYYDNGSATQGEGAISTLNPAMLGIHQSAQAIIHFAKIARKHNLTGVCLESLSRIYTIPLVPVGDIFDKFCQHVKCYLQTAAIDNSKASLEEGYKVVETTNLTTFTDTMKSEYYAMKGLFLAHLGKSDEANKAFSAAVQINDTYVKAWALWGDYLEALFTRDRTNIQLGVWAITCFLHTCRTNRDITPESKSRKYLAKVLWLLTYDDDKSSLMEALEKYSNGVPALHWLPWTPQLVSCLVQYPGEVIFNLLTQVARVFPQAVYLPMRTLYLTIKIEQRVGHKTKMGVATTSASGVDNNASANTPNTAGQQNADLNSAQTEQQKTQQEHMQQQQQQQNAAAAGGQQGQGGSIRANPPLLRCTNLLRIVRDIHPIVLQSLEGFVEEMSWFRETWYEEVLRQLRQCLAKCYAVAFENRSNVNDAKITPHISNFVHKLVTTFGTGIENIANSAHEISSLASESLARRIKATTEDPVFQKIKTQFTQDFDSSHLTTMKLHNLINKLKKWVKILESKTKVLPRSLLIEEKCRFLSNFSLKTAEVELPGEFLLPKHPHYFVRIARFMPKADIVQKHNTAARRLYIRGHNGKIYPYLVVIDGIGDGRREERVLQLLRMLNHYLCKQKETSKRFLHYTVPRVVAVSPQIRLVEDNPASISLLDIFKNGCAKLNIDYCAPITMYYERLANAQQRGQQASHPMLRDILKSVQSNMVPKTMLKNWALQTFPSATDYWTFRKMFTLQLALACFGEYVLHLTRLNPDMMYLHQDSGLINISYFKFDVDDHTGELDTNRPVPFRLTPNIIEFLTSIGVSGPLTASMIAAARCLVQPNFKVQSILRAILKDEMIAGHKKKLNIAAAAAAAAAASSVANASSGGILDNTVTANIQQQESDVDHLINMVNKAVNVIASRLNGLANFDVHDSKVSTLVVCASSADNLCRMDPAWHPWL